MEIQITELDYTDNFYQFFTLLKQLTSINPEKISYEQFKIHLDLIKTNPLHKVLIAKCGEVIVGTTTLIIEPKFIHDLSFVGHIEDVVVSDKCRGKGIGRLLVNKAIEISRNHNCYKVILDCKDNMIDYYKTCGFFPKERQMALYLMT